MFIHRTVLVLGAAASRRLGLADEVNFPLGGELKTEIARIAGSPNDPDGSRADVLISIEQETGRDSVKHLATLRQIANGIGFAQSVDAYLEMWRSDQHLQVCAKAIIARIISGREGAYSELTAHKTGDNQPRRTFDDRCYHRAG